MNVELQKRTFRVEEILIQGSCMSRKIQQYSSVTLWFMVWKQLRKDKIFFYQRDDQSEDANTREQGVQ